MILAVGVALALFAAVAPALSWSLLVWWCDRYEREPLGLAIVTFWWGAVPAVVLSVLAEGILGIPLRPWRGGLISEVVEASAVAPVVEEGVKGLALLFLFFVLRREFDGVLDGIIYGALIGFGFAMTENLLYYMGALAEGGLGSLTIVIFLRAVLFGLNHAFFTAITGAGLGLARLSRHRWGRWGLVLLAWAISIAFHAVHNLGASLAQANFLAFFVSVASDGGGVLLIVVIALLAWQREREWIIAELADEVGVTLSREEYAAASSYGRRMRQWFAGARGRRLGHLHDLATELAFKKRQLRLLGAEREPRMAAEIVRLRERIREARLGLGMPPLRAT